MKEKPLQDTGFTVVELVVVIILLGILSVYAVPRFVGVSSFERSGFYQETVSAARYANRLAVGRGDEVSIQFKSNGYKISYDGTPLPEQGHPVSSKTRTDITLTIKNGTLPHKAAFDALGRCYQGCEDNLTISVGGREMKIYEETGYVDTSP